VTGSLSLSLFLFLSRKAINPHLSALVSPADRCVSSPPQMGSTLTRPEEGEEEVVVVR